MSGIKLVRRIGSGDEDSRPVGPARGSLALNQQRVNVKPLEKKTKGDPVLAKVVKNKNTLTIVGIEPLGFGLFEVNILGLFKD